MEQVRNLIRNYGNKLVTKTQENIENKTKTEHDCNNEEKKAIKKLAIRTLTVNWLGYISYSY